MAGILWQTSLAGWSWLAMFGHGLPWLDKWLWLALLTSYSWLAMAAHVCSWYAMAGQVDIT